MTKVLVIGAAGRVGWPFCGYASACGYEVLAYDRDPMAFNRARDYVEQNANPGKFDCSHDPETYRRWITEAEVIVIMVGTPVDAEGNPRTDGLEAIRKDIAKAHIEWHEKNPYVSKEQLVILRSTVSPGTTNVFEDKLWNDLYSTKVEALVVFAPERIAQGYTYTEMPRLPQLIGASDDYNFKKAEDFFSRLSPSSIRLTTKQAELGKLMTNMYRYVNFALANEFMMISHHHNQDYESIRTAVNYEYPRMNLEKAGPNSGGPCLFKDGTFLISHLPYTDLIRSSFAINEGMPGWIFERFIRTDTDDIVVGILGMTFKGDNDDTRYSLSFKLKKILKMNGIDTICFDPYLEEYKNPELLKVCDVVVVMTPHSCFNQEFFESNIKPGAKVIDIWKKFPESCNDWLNGIYNTQEG